MTGELQLPLVDETQKHRTEAEALARHAWLKKDRAARDFTPKDEGYLEHPVSADGILRIGGAALRSVGNLQTSYQLPETTP